MNDTLKAVPQCLHYRVFGLCYWLVCDGAICNIHSTLKVEHYLPDAVVSVYRQYQNNPWDYANRAVDTAAYQAGVTAVGMKLGGGNESTRSQYDQDTHFKEVDIIGNPAISVFSVAKYGLIPASLAKPFMPYYVSLADAYVWRSPLVEMTRYPANLLPGVHIVGSLLNNWGSIYPRTGFILQPQDVKAAAVIAQRAADITTRSLQPHIYHPLPSGSCGSDCTVVEVKENNTDTQWQMIYPIVETECSVFGKNDLKQRHPWGSEAARASKGDYVWVLWRRYHGCIPADGKYLGSTTLKRTH